MTTSAKTGKNVDNLFKEMTQKVLGKIERG